MKFARSAVLALALAAGSILTTPAFAAPTDAQVTAAVEAYKKSMAELEAAPMAIRQKMTAKSQELAKAEGDAKATLEAEMKQISEDLKKASADLAAARKAAIAGVFEAAPIAELSISQIRTLQKERILGFAPDRRGDVHARLTALAADKSAGGAEAALLAADFIPFPAGPQTAEMRTEMTKKRLDAVTIATKHPAFGDAIKQNADLAKAFIATLGNFEGADLANMAIWNFVADAIPAEANYADAMTYVSAIDVVADPDAKVPAAQAEAIRGKLVTLTNGAKTTLLATKIDETDEAKLKKATELRDAQAKRLDGRLEYLNGAYAKNQLLGHPCPKIDFEWSSGDLNLKSIEDLKGKVVVLDFWATWCGPCVGSFPQVRDLTAHYAGYPVVVLGVTSIQGSHYKRSLDGSVKAERIDTKDDPAKEMALMTEFMRDMNVTWNVAFSKQNVFNPDFGINGIPHVAILDPNGVVRFRGLHPASDAKKKHEMIDGLLKEFKLPTPPADGEGAKDEKPAAKPGN